jgi:hypothetical protein
VLPEVNGFGTPSAPVQNRSMIAVGTMRLPSPVAVTSSPRTRLLREQIKFKSDSLTADLCLGVAIAGVNTLIGIGLFVVVA